MSWSSFCLVLVIGVGCWGSWPLIAQKSTLGDPFVRGFLVNAVTLLGFLPFLPGRISLTGVISGSAGLLIVAGFANLAGHLLFPVLQTSAGSQLSVYMILIQGMMVLVSAIGGPIFFGDPVTWAKSFFTLLILIGISGLAYISVK